MILDVGCGEHKDGDVGLDAYPIPGVDIVHDVTRFPWPIPDGAFSEVRAHQVIEHLPTGSDGAGSDLLFRFFDECYRILEPGGLLRVDTPHVRGIWAFHDITHRRFFQPSAFSMFWERSRNSSYPRRIWELVSVGTVDRWSLGPINEWHLCTRFPRWFGAMPRYDEELWIPPTRLMKLVRRIGPSTPKVILLLLRKPR